MDELNFLGVASDVLGRLISSGLCQQISPPLDTAAIVQLLQAYRPSTQADLLNLLSNEIQQQLPAGLQLLLLSSVLRGTDTQWAALTGNGEDGGDEDEASGNEDDADDNSASSNPLTGKTPDEMATFLLQTLKEHSGLKSRMVTICKEHGADGVWSMLLETNRLVQEDDGGAMTTVVAGSAGCPNGGGRKRTAGGIFLKVAKTWDSKRAKASLAQSTPAFALRPYQLRAVEAVQTGGPSVNWIVAAPTGTGKTAIVIECARRVLQANPGAKIFMIVPTVVLARQQCVAFEKAGFGAAGAVLEPGRGPWHVDHFSSDHHLSALNWEAEIKRLSVIVATSAVLLNCLDQGAALLDEIDLLIIDECHNTTKQHPYVGVVRHHPGGPKPQLIGISASPACTAVGLTELRIMLRGARLHVIPEDDEDVQQVAPAPNEAEQAVPVRDVDHVVATWLLGCMEEVARHIGDALGGLAAAGPPHCPAATQSTLQELAGILVNAPRGRVVGLQLYNTLCQFVGKAMEVARAFKLLELGTCLELCEVLRKAYEATFDVGYECAFQYTGHRMLDLAARYAAISASRNQQQQGEAQERTSPGKKQRRDGGAGSAAGAAGPAAAAASAPAGPDPLAALVSHAASGPSAHELRRAADARQPLADLPPCEDIGLTLTALCIAVLDAMPRLAAHLQALRLLGPPPAAGAAAATAPGGAAPQEAAAAAALVQLCIGPALGLMQPAPYCFPKITALIDFLKLQAAKPAFHGIIFMRTRQGAFFVAETLRACSGKAGGAGGSRDDAGRAAAGAAGGATVDLTFIDSVDVIVGHGARASEARKRLDSDMLGGATHLSDSAHHARGMSSAQQTAVLDRFRAPGKRLLVATTVVEEGLDVPCCDFVVRFTPPGTGIQRAQSRGRSRALASEYLVLVSQGGNSTDLQLNRKSKAEEQAMRALLAAAMEAPPGQV